MSFVDEKAAYRTAAASDVTLPFGGVPMGIKELVSVLGWPATEASLVLADQVSPVDSTMVRRLRAAGAVLCAQTTSSEFGGINCTSTRLHGTTTNPWDQTRTPGAVSYTHLDVYKRQSWSRSTPTRSWGVTSLRPFRPGSSARGLASGCLLYTSS